MSRIAVLTLVAWVAFLGTLIIVWPDRVPLLVPLLPFVCGPDARELLRRRRPGRDPGPAGGLNHTEKP